MASPRNNLARHTLAEVRAQVGLLNAASKQTISQPEESFHLCPARIRIGRLTTVGQVAAELGRLYRQARRGDVPVTDASRLATILAAMRQCLEASELERRIAAMEAALAPANATCSVVQLRSRR